MLAEPWTRHQGPFPGIQGHFDRRELVSAHAGMEFLVSEKLFSIIVQINPW